jgi:integrase
MAGTKGAAIKLYQKRKTEVLQGRKLPEQFRARVVPFADLAADALAYSKANKTSHDKDTQRMKKLLGWLGTRPADSITPQEVERWLADRADENDWSPATVNRYKALLSLTFRLAMENGKANGNPARLVRRRRENNARVRFLSYEEEVPLRAYIAKHYPEHLPELDVALHTGMRKSEQYGLTWDCIDFERRVLTLPLDEKW